MEEVSGNADVGNVGGGNGVANTRGEVPSPRVRTRAVGRFMGVVVGVSPSVSEARLEDGYIAEEVPVASITAANLYTPRPLRRSEILPSIRPIVLRPLTCRHAKRVSRHGFV